MKCPHCGQEHPDNTKFCPETGQTISLPKPCRNNECKNFGKYNIPPDAQFCLECGKSLAGAASNDANGTTLEFNVKGVSFKMVRVEHGNFTMGATSEQVDDASEYEQPAHRVTLTNDYYIGETPVTQALWKAVVGSNPSHFRGGNLPVENVNWHTCQEFIRTLNRLTGKKFRLPTEAEWEYAARGGNRSEGYKYAGSNNINDVAWYCRNSASTLPVKMKQPNELGLYDMSGNVCEWCNDWYNESYYASCPSSNPRGPYSGGSRGSRVLRGGCWEDRLDGCRVSYRNSSSPSDRFNFFGFRLALSE